METVQLALSLGNGLNAVTAWLRRSPLVLIEIVDQRGEHFKARLDVSKQVFIDELPSEPTTAGMKSVIQAVTSEMRV